MGKKKQCPVGRAMKAAGFKMASEGSAKNILKQAFLDGPQRQAYVGPEKPKAYRPADTVTLAEAKKAFRTAEAVPRQAKIDAAIRRAVVKLAIAVEVQNPASVAK